MRGAQVNGTGRSDAPAGGRPAATTGAGLEVRGLCAGYGRKQVLFDVDLDVEAGSVVAVVGANGAGKSTLLRSIAGVQRAQRGHVRLGGKDIAHHDPRRNILDGLVLVPQGGRSFADMTVRENLELGAFGSGSRLDGTTLREVYELFPVLESRAAQRAGSLSGGERGMLAIGRALVARPRFLLLDEPSIGLAPALVTAVMDAVVAINRDRGTTILLVEQNLAAVLRAAHRANVMKNGTMAMRDLVPSQLADDEGARRAFLG